MAGVGVPHHLVRDPVYHRLLPGHSQVPFRLHATLRLHSVLLCVRGGDHWQVLP